MRCIACHYSLKHLTEHRCPECGREFDPNNPATFDTERSNKGLAFLFACWGFIIVLLLLYWLDLWFFGTGIFMVPFWIIVALSILTFVAFMILRFMQWWVRSVDLLTRGRQRYTLKADTRPADRGTQ